MSTALSAKKRRADLNRGGTNAYDRTTDAKSGIMAPSPGTGHWRSVLKTSEAHRDELILADDAALLSACSVETHRASGPGGQRRNKVETAVRLTHRETGLSVTAADSRSQAQNKTKALSRMRRRLATGLRRPFEPKTAGEAFHTGVRAGVRSRERLLALAAELDAVEAHEGRMSDAAGSLGVSTAALSKALREDKDAWTELQRMRARHKLPLLR